MCPLKCGQNHLQINDTFGLDKKEMGLEHERQFAVKWDTSGQLAAYYCSLFLWLSNIGDHRNIFHVHCTLANSPGDVALWQLLFQSFLSEVEFLGFVDGMDK